VTVEGPVVCAACGHPGGDHATDRRGRRGICLFPGCGCREWVDARSVEERQQADWLTPWPERAA
jgi:hypothetical protein